MPPQRNKKCIVCDTPFTDTTKTNKGKTCSEKCRKERRRAGFKQHARIKRGTQTRQCLYCESETSRPNAKTCGSIEHINRFRADTAKEWRRSKGVKPRTRRIPIPKTPTYCRACGGAIVDNRRKFCNTEKCQNVKTSRQKRRDAVKRPRLSDMTPDAQDRLREKQKMRMVEYKKTSAYKEQKRKARKNRKSKQNMLARIYWFERQGRKCYLCGLDIKEANLHLYHLEHGTPVSKGGKCITGLACPECNIAKGKRSVDEYLASDKSNPSGNALTRFPQKSEFQWSEIR